jgi:hypothetical protein
MTSRSVESANTYKPMSAKGYASNLHTSNENVEMLRNGAIPPFNEKCMKE